MYKIHGDRASIREDRNHGDEDMDLERKCAHRREHSLKTKPRVSGGQSLEKGDSYVLSKWQE